MEGKEACQPASHTARLARGGSKEREALFLSQASGLRCEGERRAGWVRLGSGYRGMSGVPSIVARLRADVCGSGGVKGSGGGRRRGRGKEEGGSRVGAFDRPVTVILDMRGVFCGRWPVWTLDGQSQAAAQRRFGVRGFNVQYNTVFSPRRPTGRGLLRSIACSTGTRPRSGWRAGRTRVSGWHMRRRAL